MRYAVTALIILGISNLIAIGLYYASLLFP